MMGLTDRYLTSIGEALILIRAGEVMKELVLVLKFADGLELEAGATWDSLATAAPPASGFAEARKHIREARARRASEEELDDLEMRYGWIFTTVSTPEGFTPSDAYEVLRQLHWNQSRTPGPRFWKEATTRIQHFDGTLRSHQDLLDASRDLLKALAETLDHQLHLADGFAISILAFSQASVDVSQTASALLANDEVNATLESIARKNIKDDKMRDLVLTFPKNPGSMLAAK